MHGLGWSDIVLFAMFKNGHYDADQVRFYESNSKNKIGEFCPARQSVHFKKITGTLKLIFNF